jgi:ADP-heptose:LPS heptosyltransferase
VSKFFRDYDLSPSDVLIGYNVSAGKPTRLWALEKAAELIHNIRKYLPDATVILISSPDDRERGVRLRSMCGGNAIHVPSGLNILDVAALLNRVNALISPDTSLIHIARSFKVPVVGLYPRPEWNLNRWRPYGQSDGVVRSTSEGDIFDITVDQVFAEFCAVYEKRRVISP